MPLARGEVVDLLVGPRFQRREMLVEEMYLCVVGAITGTLESVSEEGVDALLVVRWDIKLQIVPRINRGTSSLLCHHQPIQQGLVVMVKWVVVCRGEVIKLMEVVGDDNKPNDLLTTSHCRMLRAIQI